MATGLDEVPFYRPGRGEHVAAWYCGADSISEQSEKSFFVHPHYYAARRAKPRTRIAMIEIGDKLPELVHFFTFLPPETSEVCSSQVKVCYASRTLCLTKRLTSCLSSVSRKDGRLGWRSGRIHACLHVFPRSRLSLPLRRLEGCRCRRHCMHRCQ